MAKTRPFKGMFAAVLVLALGAFVLPQGAAAQDSPDFEVPFVDEDNDGINDLLQSRWGLRFVKKQQIREAIWDQLNIDVVFEDNTRMVDTDGDGVGDVPLCDYIRGLLDTDGDGVPDITMREYLGRESGNLVDTDGDGIGDTPVRDYIRGEMDVNGVGNLGQRLIDTDGDGEGDTRLRDYMVELLDTDGDGIPDMTMREYLGLDGDVMQQRLRAAQEFRDEMQGRREQGQEPFIDEDGDGKPDDLPEGFRWNRGMDGSDDDHGGGGGKP